MSSFPEFRDQNSFRSFPVMQVATKVSNEGFVLPNTLFLGAQINSVPSIITGFYIREVRVSPDLVYFAIGLDGESAVVAEAAAVFAEGEEYKDIRFYGKGVYSAINGLITIGDPREILTEMAGTMRFSSSTQSGFEPVVVSAGQPAVSGISFDDDNGTTLTASGIVRFVSGQNIRLTRQVDGSIRVDAISGENLNEDCAVPDPGTYIKSINGLSPDSSGNFTIEGSECISVEPDDGSEHQLNIIDLCSTSCCGCDELETLMEGLNALTMQEGALRQLLFTVTQEQGELIANLQAHLSAK